MITVIIKCRFCGSTNLVKNGHNPEDKQRCLCKDCKRTFQIEYSYNACKEGEKPTILKMSHNGSGIRDIARVLQINTKTVLGELKKNKVRSCKPKNN